MTMNKFKLATDPEQMKSLFQERLPVFSQGRLRITRCRVVRARYRSILDGENDGKRYLSIRYEIGVSDRSQQTQGVQLLYAKAYLEGQGEKEFQKIRRDLLSPPPFGEAIAFLPELDMIIWAFPNDPELAHLPELIDPEKVKKHLPYSHLPSGLDQAEDVQALKVDVVRYHPEVRCTMRYRLTWGTSKKMKSVMFYGKTFSGEEGKVLFQLLEELWAVSKQDPDSFIIAQPLTYNPSLKMVWQEGLTGQPLVSLIDTTQYKVLLEAAAKNLASLHKSTLSDGTPVMTRDHLPAIQKKISRLIEAFPKMSPSLKSLALGLESDLTCLIPHPSHGAFRIKEILVCERGFAVFDLDNVAIGDSSRDLALFLVDLYCQYPDTNLLNPMARVFYHSYRAQVPWETPLDRLNWHIQVQFIKRAYWIYKNKQQDPRMEKRIQETLALAQIGIDLR